MKSLRAYRRWTDLPISRRLKGTLGIALTRLFPARAARVRSAPYRESLSSLDKLIRNGHLTNAVRTGDHGLIRDFMAEYWASPVSAEFYDHLSHRYESLFLAHHAGIVDETVKAIGERTGTFRKVIEIGSGDGKILKHFSERLAGIGEFHGVDLNPGQTEENRTIYRDDPRLHFHNADAKAWLAANLVPGTVVLSNGGVFEYFTRPELEDFFRILAAAAPVVVCFTESVATDHDLENEPGTFPYGGELSLSHNYTALLKEAGFTISCTEDRKMVPGESDIEWRWLQVVATKG